MKQIATSYSISGNQVTLNGVNVPLSQVTLISDVSTGTVLYSVAGPAATSYTQSTNSVITLSSAPSANDSLYISYDDGVKSVNSPTTVTANVTFPATQAVSGTVTANVQGGNSTAVKIDGSAVTQPVSLASVPSHAVTNAGTFAVQNTAAVVGGNATAVKVDGSAVTQPVSGTVTVSNPQTSVSITGTPTVSVVSGTVTANVQGGNSTAVKVDGSAVTQPVSLSSVPSHAVTNTGTFAVQNTAAVVGGNATAVKIDGSAVTQPVSLNGSNSSIPMVSVPAASAITLSGSQANGFSLFADMPFPKDATGRLKVTEHQNVYDADFEYGLQTLRWENYTNNGGTITHLPGTGGAAMYLPSGTTNPGAITIRQSRPYHRYQPGKSMYMATALNLGPANGNQFQRFGFFDDSNGMFFQQGITNANNPFGMSVVIRSDTNYYPNGNASSQPATDTVIDFTNWSDPHGIKSQINWNLMQMFWMEYAWYGAGVLRWGILINGIPYILHEIGAGNNSSYGGGTVAGASSTGVAPWCRTGNLPVRYEQRDSGTGAPATTMYHYGVSVMVEGRKDEQRGFTYSYGMDPRYPTRYVAPNSTRFPLLSIQPRVMGTQELSNVGGVGLSQVNITAATTTSITLGTSVTLPPVKRFYLDSTNKILTIVFNKQHNLNSTGSITLSGFTPTSYNISNSTYTIVSPSSIQIIYSTAQSGLPTSAGTISTNSGFATNQWVGRSIFFVGSDGQNYTGKITSNTANVINFQDTVLQNGIAPSQPGSVNTTVTPTAAGTYIVGQINRGQLLPQKLVVTCDSLCLVELIASYPDNPVSLTGANFQPLATLGSSNSFATRDVSATSINSNTGEVVYAFVAPAGGSGLQNIDFSSFFPLLNTITGNNPDILTVAISTKSTNSPGIEISLASASGTTGTIGFVAPHNLNVGDKIIMSGFTPSNWNATFTVQSIVDAFKISVTVPSGTTSATSLGVSIFQNGSNVSANLICQEAMS